MLQFADGIGGHPFRVFFLDLDLFDCDELGRVGAEMAQVYVCVCTFSEFLPWDRLADVTRTVQSIGPLTYLCFSSSFICSVRSWPALLLVLAASGRAPLDAAVLFASFVRLAVLFSAQPGMTRGELAMVEFTAKTQ